MLLFYEGLFGWCIDAACLWGERMLACICEEEMEDVVVVPAS